MGKNLIMILIYAFVNWKPVKIYFDKQWRSRVNDVWLSIWIRSCNVLKLKTIFRDSTESCIVCNFWFFNFKTNVSIFQEHSKKTKIQVYILPIS